MKTSSDNINAKWGNAIQKCFVSTMYEVYEKQFPDKVVMRTKIYENAFEFIANSDGFDVYDMREV